MIPSQAIAVVAEPTDWIAPLLPEEEAMVARAVDRRRREVSAGRASARRALARLGAPSVALPSDGDRLPRWPAGVVGSITHTRDFCAAAVAWQRDQRSIGIDAERAITRDSRADIMRLVATPREATWLAGLAESQLAIFSALLFSVKEAMYKCQFPLTREMLDFSDLEMQIDLLGEASGAAEIAGVRTGSLQGAFRAGTAAARLLPPLSARFAMTDDLVLTGAFLTADGG